METLDKFDTAILNELQTDGRLTNAELAQRVGLSPAPCWRRVRSLEERGFIQGYRAVLDRKAVQLATTVFVNVRLMHHREDAVQQFEAADLTASPLGGGDGGGGGRVIDNHVGRVPQAIAGDFFIRGKHEGS